MKSEKEIKQKLEEFKKPFQDKRFKPNNKNNTYNYGIIKALKWVLESEE